MDAKDEKNSSAQSVMATYVAPPRVLASSFPSVARYEEELLRCLKCGMCRAVCPVFQTTMMETGAARGKVALVEAAASGGLEESHRLAELISQCLNCKACVEDCPSSVRVDDLVLAARADLVKHGWYPPGLRAISRMLVKRGRLLPPAARWAGLVQRVLLSGLPADHPIRYLLPAAGGAKQRVMPPLPTRVLRDTLPGIVSPEGSRKLRVGYFVGCATNLVFPRSGIALVNLLTEAGIEVVIPSDQGCCGTPLLNVGDLEGARDLAHQNLASFKEQGLDVIVTGCASCGLTLKREYSEHLGLGTDPFRVPVMDLTEFLVANGIRPQLSRGREIRVTYHDPCHLVRGQGISDEPRQLIQEVEGVELVEMDNANRCCGGAGLFTLKHYDLSRQIGAEKADSILATGAGAVVTECPGCMLQLHDMLAQRGERIQVLSVAELLAGETLASADPLAAERRPPAHRQNTVDF